jgi:hypothetical protein
VFKESLTMVALLVAGVSAASAGEPDVVPSVKDQAAVSPGSCIANARPVDLDQLLILQNSSARMDTKRGYNRVRVSGETVYVDIHDAGQDRASKTVVHRMDSRIEPDADVDVIVALAMFETHLVIYWKESFLHRSYRQGVFRIGADASIEPLCEGRGGIDSSH